MSRDHANALGHAWCFELKVPDHHVFDVVVGFENGWYDGHNAADAAVTADYWRSVGGWASEAEGCGWLAGFLTAHNLSDELARYQLRLLLRTECTPWFGGGSAA